MCKIENLVKDYSSQKLKEIIEHQCAAYSESFIDYSKDELIRRSVSFQFNAELEKEVAALSDFDLKNLVEKEWSNFHLEYLEIARIEYLQRGFKNESSLVDSDKSEESISHQRYPALRTIASVYSICSWVVGIISLVVVFYTYSQNETEGLIAAVPILIIGGLVVLGLLAFSQLIKVVIDIEENTRKANE